MKKASVYMLTCVGVAIVALPPVFGILTESQFRQRIDEINDYGIWSFELNAFERGWFGSSATIDVGLSSEALPQLGSASGDDEQTAAVQDLLDERLAVLVDVAHGPVVLRNGPFVGLAGVTARPDPTEPDTAALEDSLGIPYLFEFRGRAGLFGGLRFDADVPTIDYATGDSEAIFSGVQLEGRLNGNELLAHLEIDSFAWSNPLIAVSVDAVTMNADTEFLTRYQWLGDVELLIGQTLVVDRTLGGEPAFEAANIVVRGESYQNGDGTLLATSATYAADYLNFGERFRFTDSEVVVGIDSLDADAMNDLMAAQAQLEELAAETGDPMPLLMPVFLRLLAAEPTLSIDPIRFAMDDETFEAYVHIRTNAAALPDAAAALDADPTLLIDAVTLEAEATASRALALRIATEIVRQQLAAGAPNGVVPDGIEDMVQAQANAMLNAVVAQGFLVEDGESYRVALEFVNGEFSLNGSPLPFLSFR